MKRAHFLSRLFLLLVLPLAGCIDVSGPSASIEGIYTLRQVNGQNLPVIIWDDAQEREEILSGSLTINANGTWSDTHTLRFTHKPSGATETETFPDNGTFTLSGSSVQFSSAFGGTYPGVWNGDRITVELGEPGDPLTLTYRR